jgi:oligoendopeptidase F
MDGAQERIGEEPSADLPSWQLEDLYSAPSGADFLRDVERAKGSAREFAGLFKGRLAGLSGEELAEAIAEYEALSDLTGRIGSYAGLLYAGDMADEEIARFHQNTTETLNAVGADLLFFTLEINAISDEALEEKLKSSALAHYRPWLDEVRSFRPHQLSDDLETLLHDKYVSGRAAWTRLYDETLSTLRVEVDGEALTLAEVLNRLSDRDGEVRKTAALALSASLKAESRLFALITNTLIKDKEIEDKWRKFATPAASRHLANQVEEDVVEALAGSVAEAYPRLSHRYYALKARWMGKDPLDSWDRNAPLPEDGDEAISWEEAREIVLSAYGAFSPKMAGIAQRFFDERWIDAPPRPGKESGAFSHPTVPSAHPYILMNFQGKTRDVMTLAHELGHGVHQVLAAPQGALMAGTPLTLAETASVFGEMLTFRSLLARQGDPLKRRILIAGKVEDMLNTVVRQIAFHRFETVLHGERRQGELSLKRINDAWMETQRESLGPSIRLSEGYEYLWGYISHFIHVPFYVYAYAFGDCLVNSLYAAYEEKPEGFEAKYIAMLQAGGTLKHRELLAPFGLDASDPAFWSKGLSVIEGFIDELEAA